jgi:hypothetical protein
LRPRPGPVFRPIHQARSHGVRQDVLDRGAILLVTLDRLGGEALAEEVILAPVLLVEALGVAAVDLLHPAREVGIVQLDYEVEVIAHQAAGVNLPAAASGRTSDQGDEHAAVIVVGEERHTVVATRRDVVEGVRDDVA